jgi:hypothetical protein
VDEDEPPPAVKEKPGSASVKLGKEKKDLYITKRLLEVSG